MEGSYSTNHFLVAFLILLALASRMKPSSAAGATPAAGQTNTEFIRTSCSSTTYPRLCFASLASHASVIQADPELLANTALSVTLDTARSTSVMMARLAQTHGLKAREAGAMRDCIEELSDSVDQLRKSLGKMSQMRGSRGGNFDLTINDIKTWVSAALTNDDTCTEGFAGKVMNGNVKSAVRGRVVNVAHLTSNALALINSFASLHQQAVKGSN